MAKLKQEIRIVLELEEGQKPYSRIENPSRTNYDSLRSYFEDIGYKVTSIEGA